MKTKRVRIHHTHEKKKKNPKSQQRRKNGRENQSRMGGPFRMNCGLQSLNSHTQRVCLRHLSQQWLAKKHSLQPDGFFHSPLRTLLPSTRTNESYVKSFHWKQIKFFFRLFLHPSAQCDCNYSNYSTTYILMHISSSRSTPNSHLSHDVLNLPLWMSLVARLSGSVTDIDGWDGFYDSLRLVSLKNQTTTSQPFQQGLI